MSSKVRRRSWYCACALLATSRCTSRPSIVLFLELSILWLYNLRKAFRYVSKITVKGKFMHCYNIFVCVSSLLKEIVFDWKNCVRNVYFCTLHYVSQTCVIEIEINDEKMEKNVIMQCFMHWPSSKPSNSKELKNTAPIVYIGVLINIKRRWS